MLYARKKDRSHMKKRELEWFDRIMYCEKIVLCSIDPEAST
jgi:hypothetical protein